MQKKSIAILGSTGSIGTQTLDVLDADTDKWNIYMISAGENVDLLIKQAIKYRPKKAIIANKTKYDKLKKALKDFPIEVLAGEEAIIDTMSDESIDIVVAAMVGYSGLAPVLNAIKHNKDIALANKETLVVAGELITKNLKRANSCLLPIDSEHSALFQCLVGEDHQNVEKIYLTASGGPFRGKKSDFLRTVNREQALAHPNWDMGAKISIDSATLMNKGFEVIEAKWLFHLKPNQIDVIVHPESIVHSLIQFTDGSIKAQCGLPDMKLPIQYALYYPKRKNNNFERFSFLDYPTLHFEQPDRESFPCLSLAYEAMMKGGNMPCILNAANEIAVQAFLEDRIKFLQIPSLIEKSMQHISWIENPDYSDYISTDKNTREFTKSLLK